LIMTVEPGFGGQSFMPDMLDKVSALRSISKENKLPFHIEVDGGIKGSTAAQVIDAGANILVAGTAFFRHEQGMSHASRELRCL
ncbi:MAG: ribulose-phosphate 3-epimerase, partial [Lentisphaeraceae bacterium]|nr:ribulose-phosphate 3-epimerase [Lentisphaeraceae bacterium]